MKNDERDLAVEKAFYGLESEGIDDLISMRRCLSRARWLLDLYIKKLTKLKKRLPKFSNNIMLEILKMDEEYKSGMNVRNKQR